MIEDMGAKAFLNSSMECLSATDSPSISDLAICNALILFSFQFFGMLHFDG